jgi:hypothetical protein
MGMAMEYGRRWATGGGEERTAADRAVAAHEQHPRPRLEGRVGVDRHDAEAVLDVRDVDVVQHCPGHVWRLSALRAHTEPP